MEVAERPAAVRADIRGRQIGIAMVLGGPAVALSALMTAISGVFTYAMPIGAVLTTPAVLPTVAPAAPPASTGGQPSWWPAATPAVARGTGLFDRLSAHAEKTAMEAAAAAKGRNTPERTEETA